MIDLLIFMRRVGTVILFAGIVERVTSFSNDLWHEVVDETPSITRSVDNQFNHVDGVLVGYRGKGRILVVDISSTNSAAEAT